MACIVQCAIRIPDPHPEPAIVACCGSTRNGRSTALPFVIERIAEVLRRITRFRPAAPSYPRRPEVYWAEYRDFSRRRRAVRASRASPEGAKTACGVRVNLGSRFTVEGQA